MTANQQTGKDILSWVNEKIKTEFDTNQRILSFEEYILIVADHPEEQLRGSAQYTVDMMDHFGKEVIEDDDRRDGEEIYHFKVFDQPIDGVAPRLIGHEKIQTQIYRSLKTFSRLGMNNKLLLLHGPNGSAKSSLAHALMGGMERYSESREGAVYTFNWVFPTEKLSKNEIGMTSYHGSDDSVESYAKLPDEEVAARISCDLRDHPFLLIPREDRKEFLERLLGKERAEKTWKQLPSYLRDGNLSHRSKEIYEALLSSNQGDYRKVLKHIQVERYFYSRRYRKGLVTVEPQLHVDARFDQLTINKSISSLPPSLHSLNLFRLTGDLIEGNRGLIEYSDLLKRPIDSFKYLLTACEINNVNVGSSIAYLDTVMIGSTNELQLDAFKEFPDFTSFKARIELIRVPYLLNISQEKEIYEHQLEILSTEKEVAPHSAWALAAWAVLTRLKKPNSINYPPSVSSIISGLTPLEKARLYDTGEMPTSMSPEDRKLLRSNLRKLRDEYQNVPYYEGRIGASARELKSILFEAAHNVEFPTISPLAILREMENFVKKVSEYEFLKQDVKDGYHDASEFVNVIREEYRSVVDREVRDCIGLYDREQWEDFILRYVQHVSLVLKNEKHKNPITGRMEDPDFSLIQEFEKIVGAPNSSGAKPSTELTQFRNNIISRVGAWSLDNPAQKVEYAKVFPEYWKKLEKHYYEGQKAQLEKMYNELQRVDGEAKDATSEGAQLAQKTISNLKQRYGYSDASAKEVVLFLLSQRPKS